MNSFCMKNRSFSRMIKTFLLILALCFSAVLYGCKKEIRYFDYASEVRHNILLAERDGFSLRIYAVEKEYPYTADGVKRETSQRAELYLLAPSGDKNYAVEFSVNGVKQSGDMSFDNVKAEYYYSCATDISACTELKVQISCEEEVQEFTAVSVKNANTLSPDEALNELVKAENGIFTELTDKYGFAGEIYIRLIYEEKPYYYIGIIDRNGNTTAFLMNAETGKVLAKRQS